METVDRIMSDTLEGMIDSCSLSHVLGLIQGICSDKAEHVQSNWQDTVTADCWDSAATQVNIALVRIRVRE